MRCMLTVVERSYLRPVVTGSICKDVAVVVETASRDGLVELL